MPPTLEPVTCGACKGLVTWVSDELKPLKPGSEYVMYQATVHCAACDQDWVTPYRTNKRPAKHLPPPGAHFFDKWVGTTRLPFYDAKHAPVAPVRADAAPVVEMCEAFGYKCAWYAVPDRDPATLVKELLSRPKRATWKDGIAAGYRGAIFVTPRVDRWTFVVSTAFLEGPALLPRLGTDAQYFASDRVAGSNLAVRGDERAKVGDEGTLMKQAGNWGIDPQTLATRPSGGTPGWVADKLRHA